MKAYDNNITENPDFDFGGPGYLKPLIQKATFRTVKSSRRRQCYTVLTVFTAGDIVDLEESVDLICTAAEDAPISLVIVGVGNRDFSEIAKLCGDENGRLRDSRGIPIAREIVTFVSFKQFQGNAAEVIAAALKEVPEQFVEYHSVMNGSKPQPPVAPPSFGEDDPPKATKSLSRSTHSNSKSNVKKERERPRYRD